MSLNNHAAFLTVAEQRTAAIPISEEAVQLRREPADFNCDAYGTGAITAQGSLRHLVMPPQHPPVYDGDLPASPDLAERGMDAVTEYLVTCNRLAAPSVCGILAACTAAC